MAGTLSWELIREYKLVFSFYDFLNNDEAETNDLGSILWFLDKSYTDAEVKTMMREVDPGNKGTFTCRAFLALMARKQKEQHQKKKTPADGAGTSDQRAEEPSTSQETE